MPYLIKTTGGKRTALPINNSASALDLAVLVEALKGLTFKVELEIKLSDVICEFPSSTSSTESSNNDTAANTSAANTITVSDKVNSTTNKAPPITKDRTPPLTPPDTPLAQTTQSSKENSNSFATAQFAPRSMAPKPVSDVAPKPSTARSAPSTSKSSSVSTEAAPSRDKPTEDLPPNSTSVSANSLASTSSSSSTVTSKSSAAAPVFVPASVKLPNTGLSSSTIVTTKTIIPRTVAPRPIAPRTVPIKPEVPKTKEFVGKTLETLCLSVDEKSTESKPIAYIVSDDSLMVKVQDQIRQVEDELDNSGPPSEVVKGSIMMAKSGEDEQWYRARVEQVFEDSAIIFYFDWGLRENVSFKNLRALVNSKLDITSLGPCAIKVIFVDTQYSDVEDFFKCETVFKLKVVDNDGEALHVMVA